MEKHDLIISCSKLKFKKNKKLIFFDEFLYNLFPKKKSIKNQFLFVNNFSYLEKKKINYPFLNKKVKIYKEQLTRRLNSIHNTNYSVNFWGLILDYFLNVLISAIDSNYHSILRIKKNYNFNVELINLKNIFFLDTSNFAFCLNEDCNYSAYIKSIIIKTVFKKKNYKIVKIKTNQSEEIKVAYNIFYKVIFNIIVFFIRLYLYIARPTVILDGYFKIKNSLLIFLNSLGQIVFFNSSHFFYKRNIFIKKNKSLRENIKITEKDLFDKIFNILLVNFFPSSYLESFNLYNENSISLNKIMKIGSAVNIQANDQYKYIAARILNKKGLLFTFQHGGFLGQNKLKISELVEKRYSSKIFYWNDKKGLGMHYLSNFKKIQIDSKIRNNSILLYQTVLLKNQNYADETSLHIKNHPYLNCLYEFYNGLDSIYKNISIVKLFPQHNVNFIKKIWIKKCGNCINFTDKNRNLNLFYKSRIVILDDMSTSLIELLYIGTPFIIIHKKSFKDYDKKYEKYFHHLIDLNILFNSSEKASQFLNRNYSNVEEWWKNINNDKIFNKFKNEFYSTKKNYIDSITKFILSFR